MPAGVAAAQARISAIENRFAPLPRTQAAPAVDFETVLASARAKAPTDVSSFPAPAAAATTAARAAAPVITSTEMGEAGAPADLVRYGNGKAPASALEPIGEGNHRLWGPAAASYKRMSEAAARDGIDIRITDSYRSYDQQVSLAERKGLYSQGGLAARPGTSNHGWGRSLDIDTSGGTVEWLRANAARYGFHEDVPREAWHWTYRPA